MPAHRKNYDSAVAMYESGMSIGEVATMFDVTRQAMHKILGRRGVEFRDQLKFANDNHFFREGADQDDRVHSIVANALTKGKLIPQPCELCGQPPERKNGRSTIEAHHDDYNKPLSVRWLCKIHHHEWHKHNKPVRRTVELPPMSRSEIAALGGRAPRSK